MKFSDTIVPPARLKNLHKMEFHEEILDEVYEEYCSGVGSIETALSYINDINDELLSASEGEITYQVYQQKMGYPWDSEMFNSITATLKDILLDAGYIVAQEDERTLHIQW